jgi:hypothetical protein
MRLRRKARSAHQVFSRSAELDARAAADLRGRVQFVGFIVSGPDCASNASPAANLTMMNARTSLIGFTIAAAAASLSAQTPQALSPPEKAMVSYIDAHEQESNALLEKLVDINSGTHNLEGCARWQRSWARSSVSWASTCTGFPWKRFSAPACWSRSIGVRSRASAARGCC